MTSSNTVGNICLHVNVRLTLFSDSLFTLYIPYLLGVDEWLVKIVQSMYYNARSRVRVNDSLSEVEFSVKVGVHQGSVLSPLLFIMVLEALSIKFRTGCPWELLYADVCRRSSSYRRDYGRVGWKI